MHIQRKVLLAICAVGMAATFLPWVNAPFVGSVAGTAGDGWISFSLFLIAGVVALLGDRSSRPIFGSRIIIALLAAVAGLLGIWKISDLSSAVGAMEGDNPFAEGMAASVSVGAGLYLLVLAGLAGAIGSVIKVGADEETPALA